MPKSLSNCFGSTVTIDKSEECIKKQHEKYEYELSSDKKQYRIVKELSVYKIQKDYYEYKNNYT